MGEYKNFFGQILSSDWSCPRLVQNTFLVRLLLSFTDLVIGWQTLRDGGKSSCLKENEIVAGMNCLEISLYNVLWLLGKKFI